MILTLFYMESLEEAKRFEEGLQDEKNFLYIQRRYVCSLYKQLSIKQLNSSVVTMEINEKYNSLLLHVEDD